MPGALVIGTVGGSSLHVAGVLSLPLAELHDAYEGAIPRAFLSPEEREEH